MIETSNNKRSEFNIEDATGNLNTLLCKNTNSITLSKEIYQLMKAGLSAEDTMKIISTFCKTNNPTNSYEDDLDDIVAAISGHCHSSYILHPSNFQ